MVTSLVEERVLFLVLFVRLFDLRLFSFVCFLFLLVSGKGCGLTLWHSLDFSLTAFNSFAKKKGAHIGIEPIYSSVTTVQINAP